MIELMFAETLFVLRLKRKPYFVLRVIFVVALLLRFSLFVPVLDYSAWYNALMFFVLFATSVLGIKFCFDESWKSIVFCAIAGYTVQHVAFTLYHVGQCLCVRRCVVYFLQCDQFCGVCRLSLFRVFCVVHIFW